MFGETDLVILKPYGLLDKGSSTIRANHFYRCCTADKGYIIYGEYFDKVEAEKCFETAIERVKRDWTLLGLIIGDNFKIKPITKKEFNSLADIHTYGKFKIVYFRGWDKENVNKVIYGFYPSQGTKAEYMKECYQMYLDTINGNWEHIDNGDIQFSDRGIVLSYGNLGVY